MLPGFQPVAFPCGLVRAQPATTGSLHHGLHRLQHEYDTQVHPQSEEVLDLSFPDQTGGCWPMAPTVQTRDGQGEQVFVWHRYHQRPSSGLLLHTLQIVQDIKHPDNRFLLAPSLSG